MRERGLGVGKGQSCLKRRKRHATTQLEIAAGKITGRWQDKVNNLDGIVNGTVKSDGFDIALSGNFFDAKMTVATAPCQQSITIVLEEGLPVKKISAVLKKC